VISDTSSYVAIFPVNLKDYSSFNQVRTVKIRTSVFNKTITGKLISFDKEIHLLNGNQVVIASALITDFSNDLFPGMITKCKITGESISVATYLKRLFDFGSA
jgi:hypothetical protein